jgi:ferritin-like metal-binding protein YciE
MSDSDGRGNMRGNRSQGSANRNRTGTPMSSSGTHEGRFQGQGYLEKFFLDQLQDIYYAEHKITQSLPKMIEAATTDELSEAFDDHLHQTQRHIKRLEKVFETIGQKAEGKKCEAIEGIAREVEQIIKETEEGSLTRDAALIIAAQKVEHYEIATYGGLVQLAITMQLHDAADLLDKTLMEEEDTDALLTEIAENDINLQAENEGDEYSWNATMIYSTGGGEEESGEEEEEEEGEEAEEESEDSETEEAERPEM